MKQLVYSVTKKDLLIDFFIASGPGGQHRNKVETACRIKHKESGLVYECTKYKRQSQNKKEAFRKLAKKIHVWWQMKESANRPEYKISNKTIRTYNECGDRVVDHRTKKQYSYKKTVGKKDISVIIEDTSTELKKC